MSPETKTDKQFGKFQSIFWPIHGYEMKKFFPMSMMMFFILFIYTLVRDIKDAIIINAPGGQAQTTSNLKVYLVLPFAMVAVIIFSKFMKKFGFDKTFYYTVLFFLLFYAIFAFLLYPNASKIHMNEAAIKSMQKSSPPFIDQLIPVIGNWSFSLFYVISELWGSLAIGALFWQFANRVTMKHEVARFYGLFACIGNVGLIFSAYALKFVTEKFKIEQQIPILLTSVLISGVILLLIYYYTVKNILTDSKFYNPGEVKAKKEKVKLTLGQALKEVFKSSYLAFIAILTVAYGVAINLSETILKDQGKMLYGGQEGYQNMMASLSMTTGVITIIVTLTCSGILRKCKWKTAALITPLSMVVLGALFFLIVVFEKIKGVNTQMYGLSLLNLAVMVGISQDAIAKGIKYSLFDSSKQMAYRPLDDNLKTTGQAAVETVGGRFGKSAGALIVIFFTSFVGANAHMSDHIWFPATIVGITCLLWIISVFNLSEKYEALKAKRAKEVVYAEQKDGDTAKQDTNKDEDTKQDTNDEQESEAQDTSTGDDD